MHTKTAVLFLFLVHVVSAQEDFRINYLAAQMDQYCDMRSGEFTGTSLSQQQPRGERIGKAGPRGSPGSVNYTMVKEMIKQTVSDLVTNLSDELSQNARECRVELETVNEKVRRLNETLQRLLTPTDLPTTTPASTTTTQKSCSRSSLAFDGKCFTVIVERLTNSQAIEKCRTAVNGQLANIYSRSHYEAVMNYIPPHLNTKSCEILLGMTYSPENRESRMSDGSRASYMSWLSGWPKSNSGYTVMALRVNMDTSSSFKGMFHYGTSYSYHGALCES